MIQAFTDIIHLGILLEFLTIKPIRMTTHTIEDSQT